MSAEEVAKFEGEPVNWGIIGCGAIATHAIAPALRWSRLTELVAVASRTVASAQAKAREVQAKRHYGAYEGLLADPDIQAVYIGLPNGLHEEWAIKAAKAGKHVLCEKSLALNSAAAAAMVAACEKAGVRLMEGFMYRHHPQWDIVRETLRSGRIGDVRIVRADLSGQLQDTENHRWSALLGGGALYDVTCYGANVARMIYGTEPLQVTALADCGTPERVDRTSATLMDFGHGRLALATGSLTTYNNQYCEVEGTHGRITIQHPFIPGWERAPVIIQHGMKREELETPGANHFLHMIEHFTMCVLDPKRPLLPGENGLKQTLVNEAIEQAWLAKKTVDVMVL